jgi:hypothetical protein
MTKTGKMLLGAATLWPIVYMFIFFIVHPRNLPIGVSKVSSICELPGEAQKNGA